MSERPTRAQGEQRCPHCGSADVMVIGTAEWHENETGYRDSAPVWDCGSCKRRFFEPDELTSPKET